MPLGKHKKYVLNYGRQICQSDSTSYLYFRFMAAGKHIGKVLIKMRDENTPTSHLFDAIPRFYCNPNSSYIIIGKLMIFNFKTSVCEFNYITKNHVVRWSWWFRFGAG